MGGFHGTFFKSRNTYVRLQVLAYLNKRIWNSKDILFRAVTMEPEESYILKILKSLKTGLKVP